MFSCWYEGFSGASFISSTAGHFDVLDLFYDITFSYIERRRQLKNDYILRQLGVLSRFVGNVHKCSGCDDLMCARTKNHLYHPSLSNQCRAVIVKLPLNLCILMVGHFQATLIVTWAMQIYHYGGKKIQNHLKIKLVVWFRGHVIFCHAILLYESFRWPRRKVVQN